MGRTVSHDITYQPSAFTPVRLVRHVKDLAPKAVAAVQQHTGTAVPPLTIAIGGRTALATTQLAATGHRSATLRNAARYWRHLRQDATGMAGVTYIARHGRIYIGISTPIHKHADTSELWATLTHEITHAIQLTRPGRRAARLADLDHDLRITEQPEGLRDITDALIAIDEAEAYTVQHMLTGQTDQHDYDRSTALGLVRDAIGYWETAGGNSTRLGHSTTQVTNK